MTEPHVTINLGPERPEDMRCDFCTVSLSRRTVWTYPCETFTPSVFQVPGRLTQTSVSHWAACDDCHPLIEQRAWDALAKRSVDGGCQVDGLALPRAERRRAMKQLKALHQEFQRHRTGPPYQMPAIG